MPLLTITIQYSIPSPHVSTYGDEVYKKHRNQKGRSNIGEGNGTHSSTLAWKIPWTEEPGRLQSMGSLRVGHDWATSLWLFTFMHCRRKWQPTPVFLPREFHGQKSLVDYSSSTIFMDWWATVHGVTKSWTQLSNQHFHFHQEAFEFLFTFCHKGGVMRLRLLIFLLAILIPACASSSPVFLMMYSAYKLNKQGDNRQPGHTPSTS